MQVFNLCGRVLYNILAFYALNITNFHHSGFILQKMISVLYFHLVFFCHKILITFQFYFDLVGIHDGDFPSNLVVISQHTGSITSLYASY
jgi:hypothetical protein